MDDVDKAAAWRELEAAIGEALWRYAEAVTGVRRERSGEVPGGRLTGIPVHLARLSAARRARQVLRAAEDGAATAAIELGASYPDDRRRGRHGPADRVEALPAPVTDQARPGPVRGGPGEVARPC